jgi:hypothetical protein
LRTFEESVEADHRSAVNEGIIYLQKNQFALVPPNLNPSTPQKKPAPHSRRRIGDEQIGLAVCGFLGGKA